MIFRLLSFFFSSIKGSLRELSILFNNEALNLLYCDLPWHLKKRVPSRG